MNERQEQTADVLGKLTVLGTIVLPMNIVTGMWGMNVLVPGQDVDNLNWFWSSESLSIKTRIKSLIETSSHCGLVGLWHHLLFHCQKGVRYCVIQGKDEILMIPKCYHLLHSVGWKGVIRISGTKFGKLSSHVDIENRTYKMIIVMHNIGFRAFQPSA